MENINAIKIGALGIAGSIIANLLGGWDMSLQTLLLFMSVDYITGLIVAGVFKQSKKSETGALDS
ncbi:MAG TPA: holin, partial [Clostridiales bacterium]|nr:holin [Clostridiales bacterium]